MDIVDPYPGVPAQVFPKVKDEDVQALPVEIIVLAPKQVEDVLVAAQFVSVYTQVQQKFTFAGG